MAKILVGSNSAALNADIIALFEEEDLDPIKEMITMAKQGHQYEDPESGEIKFMPLDPKERFQILKELAGYVAPKIKAVDVSEKRKQKTVIKIVQHGQKAILSNGEHVMEIDGPKSITQMAKEAREITDVKPDIVAAARIDAYGGFAAVREAAKDAEIIEPTIKVKDVTNGD